jgi:hypothetical protein
MKRASRHDPLRLLLLTGVVQARHDNIAAEQPVTSSRAPADGYDDPDGLKLTDGSYAFAAGDMVGFEGAEPITLVVDLGAIHDEITYVALKLMRSDVSDVALPQSFIVAVSEDGVRYEDLGMGTTFFEGEVADDHIGTMVWLDEENTGHGRFVRVDVRPGGAWTMLAEVIVSTGRVQAQWGPAVNEGNPSTPR